MKGKIYKLVDVGYNKCYIGSTVESLSNRIAKHRYSYKMWCSGKRTIKITAFDMFDEFGVDNIKIEEIEKYPCKDKAELEAREGYFIKNSDCVNKTVAGRTKQQWMEDNKENIKRNNKIYYQNKRDTLLVKSNTYYQENKEKRKEYNTQPFVCDCGSTITINSKSSHFKTLKHQNYINQMKQQEPLNNC